MKQQWGRPIILVITLMTLLIPRVRSFIFFRILRNRLIRNIGLRTLLSVPFFRDRMMNRILPTRQP